MRPLCVGRGQVVSVLTKDSSGCWESTEKSGMEIHWAADRGPGGLLGQRLEMRGWKDDSTLQRHQAEDRSHRGSGLHLRADLEPKRGCKQCVQKVS